MKFIFALALLFAPSAFACGPWGCYSNTCLTYGPNSTDYADLDTCAQRQVSHLDPNNRTETNFQILAWELSGAKTASPAKRSSDWSPDQAPSELPPEASRTILQKGIAAFRANDYEKAIELFKQVNSPEDDKSRAAYYIARSYLRRSQKNYDGYNRTMIEKEYAIKARDAFRDFVKKYPEDEWTESAYGLGRRADFLAGDMSSYWSDWGAKVDDALSAKPRDEDRLALLFAEAALMDLKDLTSATHLHPILWMVRVYYVTRQFSEDVPPEFDLNAQLKSLEADQNSFAKTRDLYAWARAVLLLKLGRAQEGYDLLQKQSVAKTNGGSLSWLVLNARLLIALGKFNEARTLLEPFIKSHPLAAPKNPKNPSGYRIPQIATYEIGPNISDEEYPERDGAIDSRNFYSMTFVWEKNPAAIASHKSLEILTAKPLARVFAQGTTPEQIVATISDSKIPNDVRAVIEPIAMAKLITMSKWAEAVEAYAHITSSQTKKDFADLAAAAKALTGNEKDAVANARVGMFLAHVEPSPQIFAPCEKQTFTKTTSAMDYYLQALESFRANEKVKSPVEAALLREMLICFKDHYGAPYCGEKAVKYDKDRSLPLSDRRAWWQRLQRRFPNSKEAKSLKIYW